MRAIYLLPRGGGSPSRGEGMGARASERFPRFFPREGEVPGAAGGWGREQQGDGSGGGAETGSNAQDVSGGGAENASNRQPLFDSTHPANRSQPSRWWPTQFAAPETPRDSKTAT